MKNTKYKFHSDPGHGWLAVKRQAVIASGIKVTSCSYQKGNTVYLEEDCDAPAFINARKNQGIGTEIIDLPANNNRSPVRSYPSFKEE